jgi:hypothetical protein
VADLLATEARYLPVDLPRSHKSKSGGKRAWQYEAVELKVWHPGQSNPTNEGLRQLDDYLDRLDLDHGTLVVFDRRPAAPRLSRRIRFSAGHTPSGRPVTLLRA